MHSTGTAEAGPDLAGNSSAVLTRQDSRSAIDSRFCCNICFDAVVEPVATLCGHLYCWPCLFRWLEPGMSPAERASLAIPQLSLGSDPNRRVCPVCKAPCSVPTLVPIYVREPMDSEMTPNWQPASASAPTSSEHRSHSQSQSHAQSTNELHDTDTTDSEVAHGEWQPQGSDISSSQTVDWSGSGESITGLRQRIRFRSRDSENSTDSVPSRPAAQSPRHHSPSSPSSTPLTPQRYGSSAWVTPLTPTGPRGSLTHGLLLSLQQATAGSSRVPPLHRRDGLHPADLDAQSGATEYLSRLLLMLACFVMLCLLLL